MKILNCFLDNRRGGGAMLRGYRMARLLRERGVDTFFLFNDKQSDCRPVEGFECKGLRYLQPARRENIPLSFFLFLCFFPWNLYQVIRYIRKTPIDLVHVNGILNWIPAVAAVLTRRRLVWHLNDMSTPRSVVRILRPIVKAWSWRIAVSAQRLTDYYFENDDIARQKIVVLFPPVDTDTFQSGAVDSDAVLRFRSENRLEGKGPVIAAIGNPNLSKGYEYLIDAASRIGTQYPDSLVLIVGDHLDNKKEYIRRLRQQIERLGLESRVRFLGFMDDVRLVLAACDVLVVSSVNEAGPMVVLEAMAMERPVVTTDVGVVRQAIVDGQSGLIVPPRRPDLLADGLLTVLAMSPERKNQMTATARQCVLDLFDIRRVLADYLNLYKTEIN